MRRIGSAPFMNLVLRRGRFSSGSVAGHPAAAPRLDRSSSLLIHAAPGGPTAVFLSNPGVRPEDIERLRRALGVDQPLWLQYWSVARRVRPRRLGLQLQRQPAGRSTACSNARRRRSSWSARRSARRRSPRCSSGSSRPSRRGRWPDRLVRRRRRRGHRDSGVLVRPRPAACCSHPRSDGCPRPAATTLGDGGFGRSPAASAAAGDGARRLHAAAWTRYVRASMIEALAQPFVSAARARGVPDGASSCGTCCARRSCRWSPSRCSTRRCSCRAPSSPKACSRGPASGRSSPRRWRAATTRC